MNDKFVLLPSSSYIRVKAIPETIFENFWSGPLQLKGILSSVWTSTKTDVTVYGFLWS